MSRRRRIVVIGAGTAGIPAALRALELGAEVTIVEKTDQLGGALPWSGAIMSAAGSQVQREKGIEDSAEAHAEEVMTLGRGRADPALLELATREAASTIDWLLSIGVRFTADSPIRLGLGDDHEAYRAPRSYVLEAPPELGVYRGPVLAARLVEALERAASPQLQIRLGIAATALNVESGVVIGASVGDEELTADAVILTTGGYGANQRLLRRFHPQFARLITQGPPHSTGDGISLAQAVGATVVNEDVVIPAIGAIEDPDRPGFRLSEGSLGFGRPPGLAGDVWVNREGRRFIAEDNPSPDARERAILEQTGGMIFSIFDETMHRGLTPEIASWTTQHLSDARLMHSASSLAELGKLLGIPERNLEETARRYNEAVDGDPDPLGRESLPRRLETPPFHGVPATSSVIVTFAGVRVSSRLEVIGRAGRPIHGLYAAGEVLGGAQIQGDGFSSGMSVTPAIGFGRLAAQYAVDPDISRKEARVVR
jgi:fumarate reductase flavoprotein subunit